MGPQNSISDYEFAYFNKAIYGMEEPSGPIERFSTYSETGQCESGLCASTFVHEGEDGKGKAVFVFLGTDSSKDKTMVKNQMKTNWQLSQNPDEDMAIAREAVDYARDTIRELRGKKRGMLTRAAETVGTYMGGDCDVTEWEFYATGHSLGGFLASVVTIELDPDISKCVTFDDPGLPKFWSKKAFGARDSQYWRDRVVEYLTFPNPINTTLPHWGHCIRLDLEVHSRTTPSHCVRCILGTALRAAVWGSALNLGLSVAGRTRGFWATKVVNASVRSSRKLLSSRLNVKEAWHELRQATREDVALRDAEAPEKGDKGVPVLDKLPPRLRTVAITAFWALCTCGVSSVSYVATRTSGNMADCSQEHTIMTILTGFDDETGEPKQPVEIESWPYHELLLENGFTQHHTRRLAAEGLLPFMPAAYGVHNILRRKKLLLARAHSLPGYKEARTL